MVSYQKIDPLADVNKDMMAIDEAVGGLSTSPIEKCIESVLMWAHKELGSDQFVEAKEQFYWKTGKIFSDDDFYVNRITYFIDHFLFERPIESNTEYSGQTPFDIYWHSNNDLPIKSARHSLFEVSKVQESALLVKDLITKTKLSLSNVPEIKFDGISKNDIFQGFTYEIDGQNFLSRGLIFHPYKAYRVIRKNLKILTKSDDFQPNLFLYRLARQQLRQCRHVHVDPKIFYNDHQA